MTWGFISEANKFQSRAIITLLSQQYFELPADYENSLMIKFKGK